MYLHARNIKRHWWSRPLTYPEYLQTKHWKSLRTKALKKYKKCQHRGCNIDMKFMLQVHHKTYKTPTGKKIFYRERLKDLQVLCIKHHKMQHRIHK